MKKLLLVIFLVLNSSLLVLKAQYILYGTTYGGYLNNQLQYGNIYSYNPLTNKQTVLFSFDDIHGAFPIGRMVYASDGMLYAITEGGGAYNMGTVFCFNPKTNTEAVVINFDSTNGYFANSGGNELFQAKDGLIYGTTLGGGKYGDGVLFSYNINTHIDSIRCNFNDSISDGVNGGSWMELWQDAGTGILYGVTSRGGFPGGGGGVFGFNPANNQLLRYFIGTLYSSSPYSFTGGLTLAKNGLLYGMSDGGGANDSGTIYSFNLSSHSLQMVEQFSGGNGLYPLGNELIEANNGLLYGATDEGGDVASDGVLFSFDPATNTEKVLVTFNNSDGSGPQLNLVQDPDNSLLYGTTSYGGDSNYGVLFSYNITTSSYKKVLDFNGPNGIYPDGLTLVDTSKKRDTGIGLNELRTKGEDVKVFPNPGNGKFTIQSSVASEQWSVEIYNVLGEKVYSSFFVLHSSFDLSGQPNGVYFYRVVSENGELLGDGKIVIQK